MSLNPELADAADDSLWGNGYSSAKYVENTERCRTLKSEAKEVFSGAECSIVMSVGGGVRRMKIDTNVALKTYLYLEVKYMSLVQVTACCIIGDEPKCANNNTIAAPEICSSSEFWDHHLKEHLALLYKMYHRISRHSKKIERSVSVNCRIQYSTV